MIDHDKLANVLDVPNTYEPPQLPTVHLEEDKQSDNDFQYARSNLCQIIEVGKDALREAIEIVSQDQNPRSIEAFSVLAKNLAEINKDLIGIHQQAPKKEEAVSQTNINNAVFVGSTNELLKMIKKETTDA